MSVQSLDREDLGLAAAGTGLVMLGFARRSTVGAGLMLLGGFLAWTGMKGRKDLRKKVVQTAQQVDRLLRGEREGPSYPGDGDGHGVRQMPEDEVDEESMESFPASDSPGHGSGAR